MDTRLQVYYASNVTFANETHEARHALHTRHNTLLGIHGILLHLHTNTSSGRNLETLRTKESRIAHGVAEGVVPDTVGAQLANTVRRDYATNYSYEQRERTCVRQQSSRHHFTRGMLPKRAKHHARLAAGEAHAANQPTLPECADTRTTMITAQRKAKADDPGGRRSGHEEKGGVASSSLSTAGLPESIKPQKPGPLRFPYGTHHHTHHRPTATTALSAARRGKTSPSLYPREKREVTSRRPSGAARSGDRRRPSSTYVSGGGRRRLLNLLGSASRGGSETSAAIEERGTTKPPAGRPA